MSSNFGRFLSGIYSFHGHRSPVQKTFELYTARPFNTTRNKKVLFLYSPNNAVAFSQIHPFLFYERDLITELDISIRAEPLNNVHQTKLHDADLVCVQTHFDLTSEQAEDLFTALRRQHPKAKFAYFDWFAPLDLRLAAPLNRHIDLYVKRQVFQSASHYRRTTTGDTNLMDHYCRKYALAAEKFAFEVPTTFYSKLHLGAGLFTGAYLLRGFAQGRFPIGKKIIDVHARLGTRGTPWYSAMRNEAVDACHRITQNNVLLGNGIRRKQYLAELAQSKICFSPFGYGEVCWRDFEAALFGSLLMKPDMSHLKTDPNMYVDGETYAAVAWDYSDLAEKVAFYSRNDTVRNRIVANAQQILRDYVQHKTFLKQMMPVFNLAHGLPAANAMLYPQHQITNIPSTNGLSAYPIEGPITKVMGDGVVRTCSK